MVALIEELQPVEANPRRTQQDIIDNLITLANKEKQNGNTSITQDKLAKLQQYLDSQAEKKTTSAEGKPKAGKAEFNFNRLPVAPKPKYSPLFNKFDIRKASKRTNFEQDQLELKPNKYARKVHSPYKKFTFERIESILVEILEAFANVLDNLHLFSKFPMFPQYLVKLLKQTNKIWVVILIFLIKKTLTQLLNVRKKEKKVQLELAILNASKKTGSTSSLNNDITRKYTKVLKDLKFDKMMLYLELIGNFLDMAFNVIELARFVVPEWFMNTLNVSSMLMTIYRMNKDDEYIDDDVTEDLI